MPQHSQVQPLGPDALAHLGLNRDPFYDGGQRVFVFADTAHKTQINVSLHMLQASDRLLLVRGGAGVGKTAFLDGLAHRKTPGLRFVGMMADESLDFPQLLQRFLLAAELIDPNEQLSMSFAAARLSEAVRAGERPVLLLDEAQTLSPETLSQLLSLRNETVADGTPFGLVLAVEPSFDGHLEAVRGQTLGQDALHIINLYPFSEKQALEYMTQRLVTAGSKDGALLSEAERREIFQRSKGVAARINAEASAVLAQKAGGARGKPARAERRSLTAAAGAVLLVAAGLGGALWYAERGEQPATVAEADAEQTPYGIAVPERYGYGKQESTTGSSLAATADTALPSTVAPGQAAPAGEAPGTIVLLPPEPQEPVSEAVAPEVVAAEPRESDAVAPESVAAEATESNVVAPLETPRPEPARAQPGGAEPDAAPAQLAAAPPAVTDAEPAADAQTDAVRTAQATAPAPEASAEPETALPAPADLALNRGREWLLGRSGSRYTVQLIAAHDRKALETFIADNDLGARVEMVKTLRDGRDWYVVFLGDFASATAARRAIEQLPRALRESGPWVRRFERVQGQFKA